MSFDGERPVILLDEVKDKPIRKAKLSLGLCQDSGEGYSRFTIVQIRCRLTDRA